MMAESWNVVSYQLPTGNLFKAFFILCLFLQISEYNAFRSLKDSSGTSEKRLLQRMHMTRAFNEYAVYDGNCHSGCSPPPEEEIDAKYAVDKRLVPTGPNPLHN
eukprot:c8271_g1_i1 orf=763-1074(-)